MFTNLAILGAPHCVGLYGGFNPSEKYRYCYIIANNKTIFIYMNHNDLSIDFLKPGPLVFVVRLVQATSGPGLAGKSLFVRSPWVFTWGKDVEHLVNIW